MRIIGVDPGSRFTGFGVIEVLGDSLRNIKIQHVNHGVILLDEKMPFNQRLMELGQAFRQVLRKYSPDQVVIEKIFLGKNVDSAFRLGHARGVILYESRLGSADVFEYATRSVKKGVTGSGAASKEDVLATLRFLLNVTSLQQIDASDALAMAYYHATVLQRERLLKTAELT